MSLAAHGIAHSGANVGCGAQAVRASCASSLEIQLHSIQFPFNEKNAFHTGRVFGYWRSSDDDILGWQAA